jgi:outer membrane protein OmpA-like peptidoglycan-associated protein
MVLKHPSRLSGLVHGLCLLGLLNVAACSSRPAGSAESRRDADRDGVIDADDFCPSVAEDNDRCHDEDGCPDLDDDGDGTPDAEDACPDEVGAVDDQGCRPPPPPGGPYVIISESDDECLLLAPVPFDKNRATLNEAAMELVVAIAECLRTKHEVLLLEVRGYRARRESRLDLATQRANAVVSALVARGIEARRLKPAVGRPTQLSRQHWDSGVVEFYVRRRMTCSRER